MNVETMFRKSVNKFGAAGIADGCWYQTRWR